MATPRKAKSASKPKARTAAPAKKVSKKPAKTVVCHAVSHTHWDRAWYLPFEKFRLRLVEVVDQLLELFATDADYKHFVFDGQMTPIEDYLEIRPDKREAIAKAGRSGRLVLGPHYILPDEFLVSGESLVRNLLIGRKVAAEFGKPAPIGYMPDSFGHVSQIPQILNGFGIDNFIFMRGIDKKVKSLGLEFLWKGADGESEVLAVNQLSGYGNFMAVGHAIYDDLFQPYDPDLACRQADRLVEAMSKRSHDSVFLFNNGHDHKQPQKTLARALRDINRHADGRYRVAHSTHEKFLKDLRAAKLDLKSYQGELRGALEHFILSGVFSARLYLKQENFSCQRLIERYAEPISAVAAIEGYPYPADQLLYAWKTLLKNHPHDDICGCSVDEVHQDMMNRFQRVEQVGDTVRDRALDNLLFQIAMPDPAEATPLLVFNTLPWPRSSAIRAIVNLPAEHADDEKRLQVVDAAGRVVPALFAKKDDEFKTDWAWGEQERQQVRVEFLARDIPAGGYEVYSIRRSLEPAAPSTPVEPPRIRTIEKGLENDLVRVEAQPDGSLLILDARDGSLLARANLFEDCGDRGDEYDFDAVPGESPIFATGKGLSWSVVQRNPQRFTARLEQVLGVPAQLESNRNARAIAQVEIPLRTDVTLYADSPRVDLRLSFVNHACDHRLRLGIEVPGKTKHVWVESKFDVIRRPVDAPNEKWTQVPQGTNAQDGWAALDFGKRGVAVFNQGLPEYEVETRDGSMCYWVTILRSVGWLSRGDMGFRPGHAGPGIATPEAQCRGEYHADIAIHPYEGTWESAGIPRLAQEYLVPPATAGFFHGHRNHRGSHDKPLRHSFLAVEPSNILASALKQAEDRPGMILRLWNPDTRPHRATVAVDRPLKAAWLVRLDEKRLSKITLPSRGATSFEIDIQSRKIVTIELEYA